MARETAGSVAGAGATLLVEAGQAAATAVRTIWTAPPIRIPAGLINKKEHGQYIEIPAAIIVAGAGLLLAYGFIRGKLKVNPFDWLWKAIEDRKDAEVTETLTGANTVVGEASTPGGAELYNANTPSATIKAKIGALDAKIKSATASQNQCITGITFYEAALERATDEKTRAAYTGYIEKLYGAKAQIDTAIAALQAERQGLVDMLTSRGETYP